MLSVHTLSTLTSRTSTGTDISSSTQVVPEFKQISDPRAALVFGCPSIPDWLVLAVYSLKIVSPINISPINCLLSIDGPL